MYKHISIVVLGLLLSTNESACQDTKKIDSLNMVLSTQSGADRFPALYEMMFEYVHRDNARALALIKEAHWAALLSGDTIAIVKSMRVYGQILRLLERIDTAAHLLSQALVLAKTHGFTREQFYIESWLAAIEVTTGQYDAALKRYFSLLPHAEEYYGAREYANTLHSIGITYYKLKDYSTARVYYEKSLESIRVSAQQIPPMYYSNLALSYAHLGNFERARWFAETSLRECRLQSDEPSMMNVMMNSHYALGVIKLGQGMRDQAEKHFNTSYDLAVNLNDSRFQLDNICLLADIYLQQHDVRKAEDLLLTGDSIIRRGICFNLEKIKVYSRLSDVYLTMRDFRRKSEYQGKYISLKDSVYNEELTTRLMRAEAELLGRENEAKLSAQAEVIALKEQIIERKETITWLTIALWIASLGFGLSAFRSYKINRRANRLLDLKVRERTEALQSSHVTLSKMYLDVSTADRRKSRVISETVERIMGLCRMALRPVPDPLKEEYIKEIETSSGKLLQRLQRPEAAQDPGQV